MAIWNPFRRKPKTEETQALQVTKESRSGWSPLSNSFGSYAPPMMTTSGELITEDIALTLDAVFACVRVVSNAVANAPWEVFAIDGKDNRIPRRDLPAYKVLAVRPNPQTTPIAFKNMMIFTAMIWGNFYAEIERDRAGRPLAMWPIHPNRVRMVYIDNELVYDVINGDGTSTILPINDMFHIHGESVETRSGLSIVGLAARSLGLAIALENFGSAYFGNGINPGHILTLEEALPPEVKDNFRKQIQETQGGRAANSLNLMVLDMAKGATFQKIKQTPNEAQFIESKKFSVLQVCRWFGVPPHMIAELERATFSNIEEQGLDFYRQAVLPWAQRAAEEANMKLFPSKDSRVFRTRFDLDYLVEGNLLDRTEAMARMLQNGVVTRNEARRKLGFNTVDEEGADVLTVQVNMTTLEFLKKQADVMPVEESPANKKLGGPGGAPTDEGIEKAHFALASKMVSPILKRESNKVGELLSRGYPLEKFDDRMTSFLESHRDYMSRSLVPFMRDIGKMQGLDEDAVELSVRNFIDDHIDAMTSAIPVLHEKGLCFDDDGVHLLTTQLVEGLPHLG